MYSYQTTKNKEIKKRIKKQSDKLRFLKLEVGN